VVIEFFGYDSQGNLVAPVKGTFSTNTSVAGGYGQTAPIIKYYPFILEDIKFQIANRAIEYLITGVAAPYAMNSNTDRGTIPFPFTMTGQTVEQLLNGSPVASSAAAAGESGTRKTTPVPVPSLDPYELNDTGFATNGGGAAFGNPNLTRQGRRR
jgi:hypothetical protein